MTDPGPVLAIVLAAGESRRMGREKPLLPLGPDARERFLERVTSEAVAAGCARVLVVLGPHNVETVRRACGLDGQPHVEVVLNPDPARGMLSSIRVGVAAAERAGAAAALVWPADHPFARASAVHALLAAWRAREPRPAVALPVHGGRRGHPVLFARATFRDLAAAPSAEGARAVVHARAAKGEVLEVSVEDAGVLADVDTPEDYERFAGAAP